MSLKNNLIINIGNDNFKKMITTCDVFVDKSLFIQSIIDSTEEAILITKARRWGKTLNMDMLKTFLSIEVDEIGNIKPNNSNKVLFTGGEIDFRLKGKKNLEQLKIATIDDGSYMKHQGHYPVIFISFKDVIGDSYLNIEDQFKEEMKQLFKEHRYLLKTSKLEKDEINDFQKFIDADINTIQLKNSLRFLSELLHKYYGEKVYILIDEYDKPINHLLENEAYAQDSLLIKKTAELITYIFSACGKSNSHLEKIIITGIFDTLKKEGGSGFNNVKVHSIVDPEFGDSFGFSSNEIDELITKLGFNNQEDQIKHNIKEWYNGYSVPFYNGSYMQVYTPWAVVNYLNDAYKGNLEPTNYWSKSGASTILQGLLHSLMNKELETKFRFLTEGKEQVFQFDKLTSLLDHNLYNIQKTEELFSYLLLNAGYLTTKKISDLYYFKIPNFEVKKEFASVIEKELQKLDLFHDKIQSTELALLGITKMQYAGFLLRSLNDLVNNKAKQAIDMIVNDDLKSLINLFTNNPFLKCEDKYLNYNLLQISAISGNNDIFSFLISRCENTVLTSQDKINGLRLSDFAQLSGNQGIIDALRLKGQNIELFIKIPGLIESITCYPLGLLYIGYNLLTVSSMTALIKVVSKLATPKDITLLQSFVIAATTDITLNIIKEMTKYIGGDKFQLCKEYDNYQKIITESPENFKSLAQFEKYSLEHGDFYTTLSTICRNNDKMISKIEVPIFSYDDNINILFGLCQSLENGHEL